MKKWKRRWTALPSSKRGRSLRATTVGRWDTSRETASNKGTTSGTAEDDGTTGSITEDSGTADGDGRTTRTIGTTINGDHGVTTQGIMRTTGCQDHKNMDPSFQHTSSSRPHKSHKQPNTEQKEHFRTTKHSTEHLPTHSSLFNEDLGEETEKINENDFLNNDNDDLNVNRETLKIFYVNINGLTYQKLKDPNIITDIKNNDIICFVETHLREDDEPPEIKHFVGFHTVVNKNKTNFNGRNIKGVSVYVNDKLQNTRIENVVSENGNLIILKVNNSKWKGMKEFFILCCYKEGRDSHYKEDNYYGILKDYIINLKMTNIVIIGDLNGRIGLINDNEQLKLTPRISDDQIVNSMGRELIEFCNETGMIIANGRYENGKCTFHMLRNNEIKKSVIDYVLISDSMMEYFKCFNVMEPVPYTDHSPMYVKFEVEIKHNRTYKRTSDRKPSKVVRPYKWMSKYQSRNNQIFNHECSKLGEKSQINSLTNSCIYNSLIEINERLSKYYRSEERVFYSEKTRQCRRHYKQLVRQFKDNDTEDNLAMLMKGKRELNRLIKTDKRINKNIKFNELIIAKSQNDNKQYWQLINQNRTTTKTVLKSDLTAQMFKTHIIERDIEAKDFFVENNKDLRFDMVQNLINSDENINIEFTITEITNTLTQMKNGKSCGPDGFVYEMFKENTDGIEILKILFNNTLNNEHIPWTTSWINPIYKSGSRNEMNSYRNINLSSVIEKLLTKMINNRLSKWLQQNEVIHPSQMGFIKGNSVLDNIFVLLEIIQIYKNIKRPLYLCFIDLTKAFDSIPKENLKLKLSKILPEGKLLNLIINLIESKTYKIIFNGKETDEFQLLNGIPQGDSMSPTLFCLYVNDLFQILENNSKNLDSLSIFDLKINSIGYADDILLMSETKEGIIKQIEMVHKYCIQNGLKMNYEKTKIMIFNTKNIYSHVNIRSRNTFECIHIVEEMKYLGMWISKKNQRHIEELIKKGKKSSYLTTKALKEFGQINGNILRDTFQTLTLSKMKYCGEFNFNRNLKELNKIQIQFYKRFFHLKNTTASYCIYGEFGIKPLEFHFYKAALNYWLKLLNCNEKNLINKLYSRIHANIDSKIAGNTWCWRTKKLLTKLHLDQIWIEQCGNQNVNYKTTIKRRLNDFFREQWINSAKHSHKGLNYLELCRFEDNLKVYLTLNLEINALVIVLKFRTGNHELAAEIGRYRNRKEYEDCICDLCDGSKIEDNFHFIVECPRYENLRETFVPFMKDRSRVEFNVEMNTSQPKRLRAIASFIKLAQNMRQNVRDT